MNPIPHRSVLLEEVLAAFHGQSLEVVVDGTLGAGGHAEALLEAHPEIRLFIGLDQDKQALEIAQKRLSPWASKLWLRHANFSDLACLLQEASCTSVDAILVDLGVSSMQLDQKEKGFSFMQEGPLDMRMNPEEGLSAADIVNTWSEQEIGRIFRDYGEEKRWKKAARAVVEKRAQAPFQTTFDLKQALMPVLAPFAKKTIHPVTLVFQALRIAVNRELERLSLFLPQAIDKLKPKGRLAVISFHSLEDRLVKHFFREAASDKWDTRGIGGLFLDKEPLIEVISKKPVTASLQECLENPRSRSAKLRIAEKIR